MKNNYRKYFLASDSTRMFLYAMLLPYVAVFLLYAVYSVIASSINMKYDSFMETLPVVMINAVFMQLCFVVIYFAFVHKRRINFVTASKLNVKPNAWMLAICICMGFALLWFSTPTMDLFERGLIAIGCDIKSDLGFELNSAGTIIFAILCLGILPAFVEEFIFRGVILQGLRKYGNCFAIIASALLFMLIHGNIQQTIYQFVFGVLAGYLVIKTGSLWVSIVIHAINNTFVITLSSIQTCMGIEAVATKITAFYVIQAVLYLILLALVIYFGIKLLNKVKNKLEKQTPISANAQNAQNVQESDANVTLSQEITEKTQGNMIAQNNAIIQKDVSVKDNAVSLQDAETGKSATQADSEEDENEIEKQFAKITFKEGYAGFMRDGSIKKEGLTGFFVALAIAILNTISMFMS